MKPAMKLALTLILALTAVDCAAPMPRGYVEVERPRDYEWRGMSSDGVIIGLRERWNDPEGPLTFWTAVLRKELEARRGYAFVRQEEVKSGDTPGQALHFMVPGAEPRDYWVAIFLVKRFWLYHNSEPAIATFEMGGPRESARRDLPLLKDFLAKLDL